MILVMVSLVRKGLTVDAASIDEGDHITATWKVGDVEHTRSGRVQRIIRGRQNRSLSFVTKSGNEIVLWTPSSRVTFVINRKAPVAQTPLFDVVGS